MPLNHSTKLFAVEDAKIAPLTADPEGGAATYGAIIDVPGIKTVGLSGTVENKVLRGDNRLLDSNSVLTELSGSVEHAKLSYDVLAAILGMTVTDSGTTPAQIATAILNAETANLAPFAFWAKTPTGGSDGGPGGDSALVFYKCVLSSFPEFGLAEEDYQSVSMEFQIVPRLSDGNWFKSNVRETAAALVAGDLV